MTKTSTKVSEIDRLIELASDQAPRSSAVTELPENNHPSLSLEGQKDPSPSMWRVLLQLRVLLPYLARVLPLLERGVLGTNVLANAASGVTRVDTSHYDQGIAELEGHHRDLSLQLKGQTAEIKFLQEQIGWLSKSQEKDTERREELAASIASLRRLVMTLGVILVILVAALIAASVFRTLVGR